MRITIILPFLVCLISCNKEVPYTYPPLPPDSVLAKFYAYRNDTVHCSNVDSIVAYSKGTYGFYFDYYTSDNYPYDLINYAEQKKSCAVKVYADVFSSMVSNTEFNKRWLFVFLWHFKDKPNESFNVSGWYMDELITP